MPLDQQRYRELAESAPWLPLFSKPFWLDAVCGPDGWSGALFERGTDICALWPYHIRHKWGIKCSVMPQLTPCLGPSIKYPQGQKLAARISLQHEAYQCLLKGLPNVAHFNQYFHHSHTNILPLQWNRYQAEPRITYVLEDLSDLQETFSGFRANIKTDIRKAERTLKVISTDKIATFWSIHQKTFDRQKSKSPISYDTFVRIHAACSQACCQRILLAIDETNQTHAGVLVVWDEHELYYLAAGADPCLRNSGAGSLLIWSAIQLAGRLGKRFNFEGSMLPNIEPFFRAFGGTLKTYFRVWQTNSRWLRLLKSVRDTF